MENEKKVSWWAKKNKKEKTSFIWQCVLWAVGIAALFIVIFSKEIFGSDALGNDEGTAASLNQWWATQAGPIFLHSFLTIAIGVMAIVLLTYISKLIATKEKGAATIVSIVKSLLKWAIIIIVIFRLLVVWGVDVGTCLVGLGLFSLIIGLGCQSLISDIVAGVFLVTDGAFEVGDIVVINGFRGTVHELGLKSTKIMDASGDLKTIANSSIATVVNLSDDVSIAVSEPRISYDQDLSYVEAIIAKNIEAIGKSIPPIVGWPFYKGVGEAADSYVGLKIIAQCREEDRFQVERDLNRAFFLLFKDNGIEIPYPVITIETDDMVNNSKQATAKQEKAAEKFVEESKEASKGLEKVNE